MEHEIRKMYAEGRKDLINELLDRARIVGEIRRVTHCLDGMVTGEIVKNVHKIVRKVQREIRYGTRFTGEVPCPMKCLVDNREVTIYFTIVSFSNSSKDLVNSLLNKQMRLSFKNRVFHAWRKGEKEETVWEVVTRLAAEEDCGYAKYRLDVRERDIEREGICATASIQVNLNNAFEANVIKELYKESLELLLKYESKGTNVTQKYTEGGRDYEIGVKFINEGRIDFSKEAIDVLRELKDNIKLEA